MDYPAAHQFAVEQLALTREGLLRQLADCEASLHEQMRAMRASGASWMQIVKASGYGSIEGVKKIVDPAVRERSNQAARARRAPAA